MQAPEFFNQQRLHTGLFVLRSMAHHRLANAVQWLDFRVRDDLADGLFDEVAPSKSKRVGFGQVLFDGQVLLR